jgi:Rod binding domain-containing protein
MNIKPIVSKNPSSIEGASQEEQVKKVAQDFESVFLELFLKSMRQTVTKSGFMDGGNAEDIYKSMLDSEYSKTMAKQNMTGLADAITRELMGKINLKSVQQAQEQLQGQKVYRDVGLPNMLKNEKIDAR